MLEALGVVIVAGLLAGWLAGLVTQGRGYGTARNIGIALAGAAIGLYLAASIGLVSPEGLAGRAIAAVIGAYVLLALVVRFRPQS
jgi:uncharacterized membrane protein YeaQ/YmgE (transglycosylase-associated protein family)